MMMKIYHIVYSHVLVDLLKCSVHAKLYK